MASLNSKAPVHFGSFLVTPQVFYTSMHSFAFVNLKPLLPGHVLVSPKRVTPRLRDLSEAETTDLFLTVQRVGRAIERVYGGSSLNVAIQDGIDAGQSVPHVHVHIISRQKRDLDKEGGPDALYSMMEGEEGNVGKHLRESSEARPKFPKVEEATRRPRTEFEMAQEADMLAQEMDR